MLKGEQTISQICSKFQIHPTQANQWREQALKFLEASFNDQSLTTQLNQKDRFIEELFKQIGKLKYEVDWLKKRWLLADGEKRKLIEGDRPHLSVREQCVLLQFNRSSLYYQRKSADCTDKDIMDKID